MIIIAICVSLVIGMLIGRYFGLDPDKCPRNVFGYDCRGVGCDHSRSELYRAKMQMAIADEKRQTKNYWKGDNE